jgi:hypothetical protein
MTATAISIGSWHALAVRKRPAPTPSARGRAVVIAAGNLPDSSVQALRWQHVSDQVAAGAPVTFDWRMAPQDLTRNVVEIWYDATDAWLQVTLVAPDSSRSGPVLPGEHLVADGERPVGGQHDGLSAGNGAGCEWNR